MRFSMAKLMVGVLLLNLLLCLSFVTPLNIGYPLLTLVSLAVIPPFVIVGVFNTRGAKQAFFLGCMVAGTPHFIFSVYMAVMMSFSFSEWVNSSGDSDAWIMQSSHLVGYMIGALGGLSGLGAFYFINSEERSESEVQRKESQADEFLESELAMRENQGLVARLPK